MSKVGRYSADRKKVETLTNSNKVITVAACGTLFFLDGSSYAAPGVTHTLPHPSDAKNGWWCKFVVKVSGSSVSSSPWTDVVLDTGGDDCRIKVRASGNANVSGSEATDLISVVMPSVLAANAVEGHRSALVEADPNADFLTILGEAPAGTQVEFVTDGNLYYATATLVTGSTISIDG